ncbi:hypothetical protein AB4Z54_36895, partial [Streptomyces sp. MCAF7]
ELYRARPRIVASPRATRRGRDKCTWIYVWTIPDNFIDTCRVEIVLLVEHGDETLSSEHFSLEFKPFSFGDLISRLNVAGFEVVSTSYTPSDPFYGILAVTKR